MKYRGRLVRTELITINQPPRDKVCPFQAANLLSILSRSGCQSAFERVVPLRGTLR